MREIETLGWETRRLYRGDLRQSRLFADFQEAVACAQHCWKPSARCGPFASRASGRPAHARRDRFVIGVPAHKKIRIKFLTRWSSIARLQRMGRVSDAKERLMKAVRGLIWEGSYGGTTIDQICEKAGVKKGSFYYFFDSKADLAEASLGEEWERRRQELDAIFSPTVPPLERLKKHAAPRHYHDFSTQSVVATLDA